MDVEKKIWNQEMDFDHSSPGSLSLIIKSIRYMLLIAHLLTGLVALIHLYIVWLEMFAWTTRGKKVFKSFPKELFEPTKVFAANQGLYNAFLVAGLVWSFFIADPQWQDQIRFFFLGCVVVAGIFGALTADKKILMFQTVPASLAILFVSLA
jgi:putative membrane protein